MTINQSRERERERERERSFIDERGKRDMEMEEIARFTENVCAFYISGALRPANKRDPNLKGQFLFTRTLKSPLWRGGLSEPLVLFNHACGGRGFIRSKSSKRGGRSERERERERESFIRNYGP